MKSPAPNEQNRKLWHIVACCDPHSYSIVEVSIVKGLPRMVGPPFPFVQLLKTIHGGLTSEKNKKDYTLYLKINV